MTRERRKTFRVEWNSPATIYEIDGSSPRPCIVRDFSNVGAKVTGVNPAAVPDESILRITPRGCPRKCRVLCRSSPTLGGKNSQALGLPFAQLALQ
jgi:hypothetical protein